VKQVLILGGGIASVAARYGNTITRFEPDGIDFDDQGKLQSDFTMLQRWL
jgi:hypothetical protein